MTFIECQACGALIRVPEGKDAGEASAEHRATTDHPWTRGDGA